MQQKNGAAVRDKAQYMAQKCTTKPAVGRVNAGDGAAPPSRVRCPLNTIDNVKAELARLYRDGKAGKRDITEVSKLANVLSILGRLIEGADIEDRLARLEQPEKGGSEWPKH